MTDRRDTPDGSERPPAAASNVVDSWTRRGYPPVQFLTFAYDDLDQAPVLDVSLSVQKARKASHPGAFLYRVERLPEAGWKDPQQPEYGNEEFVEVLR